jgi:ADP-ribose pyrophosphatase YjhB (NUDIX family)
MTNGPNWLSADDWKWVQDHMPIPCADVVPVQLGADGRTIARVGLIYRDTPHQGMRWCMVGGRMWRNESLAEAAGRQLRETLGPGVQFQIDPERQPDFVVQYFTARRSIGYLDPRQHAITLAIVVPITGEIAAMGEAESFKWFSPDDLPPTGDWGFEQDRATRKCIQRWSRR